MVGDKTKIPPWLCSGPKIKDWLINSDQFTYIVGCSSAENTEPDPKPVHSVLDLLSEYKESSSRFPYTRGSLGRSFDKDRGTDRKPMDNTLDNKESINRSISMVSWSKKYKIFQLLVISMSSKLSPQVKKGLRWLPIASHSQLITKQILIHSKNVKVG